MRATLVTSRVPGSRKDRGTHRTPWVADLGRRLGQRLRRAASMLNRIIGAPDYDGYLRHHRTVHPDRPALSRDEFVKQRLEDRYSRPGARCC